MLSVVIVVVVAALAVRRGDVAKVAARRWPASSVGTWCGWRVYVGGRAVRYNRIVAIVTVQRAREEVRG